MNDIGLTKEKEGYSTTEAAKKLGMSRVAVFKHIKSGKLKAVKQGRRFLVNADELTRFGLGGLSLRQKEEIDRSVDKVITEYGQTLKMLGQE